MGWSAAMVDGFVLAAAATDQGGERALKGLALDVHDTVAAELERLRSLGRDARVAGLRSTAARLRPSQSADAPPRARLILAVELEAAHAAAWRRGAPLPRRGFVPRAALRGALRAACRAVAADRESAELREIEEAPWPA